MIPSSRSPHIPYLLLLLVFGLIQLFNHLDPVQAAPDAEPQQELTISSSLQADSQLAQKRALPVLLMFSISGCGYCNKVESQVLVPMMISGEYKDKVIMRKIVTDHSSLIEDFDGNNVSMQTLMQRYNIVIYPTVLLVDHQGRKLTDRLMGINSVEMYSWDLDVAIERAQKKLHQQVTGS